MEKLRIVFAGFRHGHINSLYKIAAEDPRLEIVGAAEEDAETRKTLENHEFIRITHASIDAMLDSVECDVVAIGDYYVKRGSIAINALQRGKHVITDKPLCTSLEELDTIEKLAKAGKLAVGCMFDLRNAPAIVGAREIISSGKLGKVVQIQFSAQHPLLRATRPEWYFAGGMHGGTLNDIGSHAVDLIPWLVGSPIKKINAARTWQAVSSAPDKMDDAGQMMFELENGCGIMGDVSYGATDTQGYNLPTYWRFNVWGTGGMIEFSYLNQNISCYFNGETGKSEIPAPAETGENYLTMFINEISGNPGALDSTTVFTASRWILEMQKLADSTR